MYGELVPVGGGDPIPLLKETLRVGRRESCDIVLRFANVSAYHCMLQIEEGYWFVSDLKSRNGIKVNGNRINADSRKRLDPGDVISVAKHEYEVNYSPADNGAIGPPPQEDKPENFFTQSLLERAGLQRQKKAERGNRYDATDNSAGQGKFKNKDKPV